MRTRFPGAPGSAVGSGWAWLVVVVVVCGVLGGLLVPAAVAGLEDTGGGVGVRVIARKAIDGRVEFGLRQRQPDDTWGEIRLPRRRFFPTSAVAGRWLQSSPVTLGAPVVEVRVVARRVADGRVEFGLRQRQPDDTWGEIRLPRRRFFPTSAAVGRWLQSSPLTISTVPPPGGAMVVPAGAEVDAPWVDFVSVAVGGDRFGCGLVADGSVRCWGRGPAAVSPEGVFSSVSAGVFAVCGVRLGGEIHCWGGEQGGVLAPPEGRFSQVSVGFDAACAVRIGGGLACWGSGASRWWVPAGAFEAVSAYAAGAACGLRASGEVLCWGDESDGWSLPAGSVRSLDVSENYACGVGDSGDLGCWGQTSNLHSDQDAPPEGSFVEVAVSEFFGCGLRVDGEVACWGSVAMSMCEAWRTCREFDGYGIPPGPFTSIDAAPARPLGSARSAATVCGVRADGRIACWGDGLPELRVPAGRFTAVDVAALVCAVRLGGEAVCWGRSELVENLGAPPEGAFAALTRSRRHACGLRPGGEVTCWGSNRWGAAAAPPGRFSAIDVAEYRSCGIRADGEAVCWGRPLTGETPPGPFTAISVRGFANEAAACAQRPDGTATCWGNLPLPAGVSAESLFTAADVDEAFWAGSHPGGEFATVSVSGSLACGIRRSGDLECWKPYQRPALGAPDPDLAVGTDDEPESVDPARRGLPRQLDWVQGDIAGGPYTSLASGRSYTCGRRADAAVDCWGSTTGSPDGRFTAIALGGDVAAGLRPNGDIEQWIFRGGPLVTEPLPGLVAPPGTRLVDVDLGVGAACGLLDTGAIVCRDRGLVRELESRPGPYTRFSVGGGYAGSSAGGDAGDGPTERGDHVCAIRADGGIECWGIGDDFGQTNPPAPWLDIAPYRDITAGYAHTCAVGANNHVICWGDDRYNQTRSPTGTFTALSAGKWHTCGLRTDGEITCWGNGFASEPRYLAPPADRPTTPPPGPYTAVAAGDWHTCALRPDGTATCWLSY